MSLLDIANAAQDTPDTSAGTRDFDPPRAGVALFRMASVIEMGVVMSEWKGVEKKNKKMIVEFELLHPDHAIKNAQGEIVRYHTCLVYLNKSGFDKSKYMKLFNKLNYDGSVYYEPGTIPSMAKFLGKGFLGQIHHNKSKDGKKTYINLNAQGSDDFNIGAARVPVQDEMGVPTGKYKEVPVPPMHMDPRLFLWEPAGISDEQYAEMWASIHIDGKNYFQETIMGPENIAWPGSRAELLFGDGGGIDLKGAPVPDADDVPWSEPEATEKASAPAPVADVDDIDVVEMAPEPEPAVEQPKKRRKRRTKAEMQAYREEQARLKEAKAKPKAEAEPDVVDPLEALGL